MATLPDEIWDFSVWYAPPGTAPIRLGRYAIVHDYHLYLKLKGLDEELENESGPDEEAAHQFKLSKHDPRLKTILDELAKLGWNPVFQCLATPEQRDHFFPVRRSRPLLGRDASDWLVLTHAGTDGGSIVRREGDVMVVRPGRGEEKKKSNMLSVYFCCLAVSQVFKDQYEKAGLKGAVFRPIQYEPALRSNHRIYWLDSSKVAPWCRTRRRFSLTGHPLHGIELGESNDLLLDNRDNENCSIVWDDQGYEDWVARYGKDEMKSYDGVDFMKMREFSKCRNGVWMPFYLVSQKFRKWAHGFGCRPLYVPVDVVGKGRGQL